MRSITGDGVPERLGMASAQPLFFDDGCCAEISIGCEQHRYI